MAKKEKIKRLFDNIAPDYDKLKSVSTELPGARQVRFYDV